MNRDDIMRLAQESGLWIVIEQHCCEYGYVSPTLDCYPELERFAKLVAASEREACAKVCEELRGTKWVSIEASAECAEAIRARGQHD